MNPLYLLLGLFGMSSTAMGFSSRSSDSGSNAHNKKPLADTSDPDQDDGMQAASGGKGKGKKPVKDTDDPDQAGGIQTGSDNDMDMGGDTTDETDPHAGHNHGGDTSGDTDTGGDTSGDMDMGGDTTDDTDTGGDTSGDMDMGGDTTDDTDTGGDTSGDMDMGGDTTDDTDTGGDTSGDMDMGGDTTDETDPHAGHNHGGDTSDDTDTGGDTSGDMDMGGDTDTGGDTSGGGHNHVDMGTPDIPPPGVGASQSEINSYLNALSNASEAHIHDATSSKSGEHEALLDLVPRGGATHVAIGDGDWDDPSIWSNGEIPGDDARVLIPDGVSVDYSTVSDARLFTVRVDGALDFATNADSQMIFDTFVVSPSGHLTMGTEANPVSADVNIDLIVADNGRIDTNWDPMLLSRGLISHGDITAHGAEKDSHEKVDDTPMAGDNSVSFASAPEGWQVGDTIVIAGTHYDGYTYNREIGGKDFFPPEDEVRVITDIVGGEVFFEDALIYDHDTPRDDLATSVANYTRNISIESEAGADAEVFERGHVMLMHSDDVDVRFMEFTELGRTDKSEQSFSVEDINNIAFDSNVQGRYSLHLHRTGLEDPDNPTILEGNAVFGSPGWGVVHHDSNAIIDNNATYDTFGAGFVAETGNEIGIWSDNIAIFAQGVDWAIPKNTSITADGQFDTARGGEGFWFQGRMVASVDNIAASVNTGFSYFHRGEGMIDFDSSLFELPDALYNADTVTPDDVPIMIFQGNETFAAREGLHVVKANTAQGHDVWSRLEDFTAWSVINGVELEYTSHYILSEFDLIAREPDTFSQPQDGITFGNNLTEIIVIDSRIEGFENGIDLNKSLQHNAGTDLHDYFVINTDMINVNNDFINLDGRDTILNNAPTGGYDVGVDINLGLSQFGGVSITGTKTDGLGSTDFPGGMDEFTIDRGQLVEILDTTGYWSTAGGREYTLVDIYFTDRLTGDIYYETTPVYLDDYPVGDARANAGMWADNVNNGVQNVGNFDPVAVPSPTIETMSPSIDALNAGSTSTSMNAMTHNTTTHTEAAFVSDIWMDGYDGDNVLSLGVDDGTFTNTGDMANADLVAMGGETVLASGGGEFELGGSRTLAVFEAAAQIGFDGEDGDIAILDMEEGSTVAFAAHDGGLGTIEEFDSEAFEGPTNVLSGIDLGNATLSIDLAGLSAEAGTAFTLMSADEIVGVFNEAVVGGLGARDARIVVDYENDSVSLELVAGDGAVTVDALGAETDVTSGEEALWDALTAGQSILSDTSPMANEEEELLDEVA